jgi:hypothetical protein
LPVALRPVTLRITSWDDYHRVSYRRQNQVRGLAATSPPLPPSVPTAPDYSISSLSTTRRAAVLFRVPFSTAAQKCTLWQRMKVSLFPSYEGIFGSIHRNILAHCCYAIKRGRSKLKTRECIRMRVHVGYVLCMYVST